MHSVVQSAFLLTAYSLQAVVRLLFDDSTFDSPFGARVRLNVRSYCFVIRTKVRQLELVRYTHWPDREKRIH
jgi:hypothetical protein